MHAHVYSCPQGRTANKLTDRKSLSASVSLKLESKKDGASSHAILHVEKPCLGREKRYSVNGVVNSRVTQNNTVGDSSK